MTNSFLFLFRIKDPQQTKNISIIGLFPIYFVPHRFDYKKYVLFPKKLNYIILVFLIINLFIKLLRRKLLIKYFIQPVHLLFLIFYFNTFSLLIY